MASAKAQGPHNRGPSLVRPKAWRALSLWKCSLKNLGGREDCFSHYVQKEASGVLVRGGTEEKEVDVAIHASDEKEKE